MNRKPRYGTHKRLITEREVITIRAALLILGHGTAHDVNREAQRLGFRKVHARAIAHVLRNAAARRTLVTVPRPDNPRSTQQSWLYYAR